MRIGLIARADSTGLGIQSKEFFDHIPNCKALVIDSSRLPGAIPHGMHFSDYSKYPNQQQHSMRPGHGMRGAIPYSVIEEFISDVDIVFAMETPYDFNIFDLCQQRGVKTILQYNYEFLDYPSTLPYPDLFAAPSMWNYDHVPDNKVFLPVPVNTDKFKPGKEKNFFIHNVGRPAIHDRNGTMTVLNSLRFVENKITLALHSQQAIPIPVAPPENVNLLPDFGNTPNYYDNYSGGVLILPRKYGGLSLPMNEALAAEMPIIASNISPNNLWLPKEWLVDTFHCGVLRSKKTLDYFECYHEQLAAKIDQFCDPVFYEIAVEKAKQLKETISWKTLLPKYMETFENLLK